MESFIHEFKIFLNSKKEFDKSVKGEENLFRKFLMCIPNSLTYIRMLSPTFITPLVLTNNYSGALIAMVLAASTDFLDGFIARKGNVTSEYGRNLDALADKFFALSLSLPLIVFPENIISLILGELFIIKCVAKSRLSGNNPQTTILGKVKSSCVFSYLIGCYLFNFLELDLNNLIVPLVITNTLQVATALEQDKINKHKQRLKEIELERQELENLKISLVSKDVEISKVKTLK